MATRCSDRRFWFMGVLFASIFFALLAATTRIRFATSDDVEIARSVAGFWGGIPVTFSLYVHPLLIWPLSWLQTLFPYVVWFAWLQLYFIWFSLAVIMKASLQAAKLLNLPTWPSGLMTILYVAAVLLENTICITYTVTATILASASIFQLFAIDFSSRHERARGIALSLSLLVMTYLLRSEALLPAAVYWLGALTARVALSPPDIRQSALRFAIKASLLGALCLVAMFGLRITETALQEKQDFVRWSNVRTLLTDYGHIGGVDEAALQEVNWTDAEKQLFSEWYMLEANMTSEALETLEAHYQSSNQSSMIDRIRAAWRVLYQLNLRSGVFSLLWKLAILITLFALISAIIIQERRGLLLVLGCAALTAALITILSFWGRFPLRAASTILFPSIAAQIGLSLIFASHVQKQRRFSMAILATAATMLLMLCGYSCMAVMRNRIDLSPSRYEVNATDSLADYARTHPQLLFFQDITPDAPVSIFADLTPVNNLVSWGGWNAHSDGCRRVLANFGLDDLHFSITSFLREDVRLITTNRTPSDAFLLFLAEQSGKRIHGILTDKTPQFNVFRFAAEAD